MLSLLLFSGYVLSYADGIPPEGIIKTPYSSTSFLPGDSLCPAGDVLLTTQAAVDSLASRYPQCQILDGSLRIFGADIQDLSPLSGLRHIGGSLVIEANPNLYHLNGLDSLRSVAGDLIIQGNAVLNDFWGLNQLETVGGNFTFLGNDGLSRLGEFDNLRSVGAQVDISYNAALRTIETFGNLQQVNSLSIQSNYALVNIGGIDGAFDKISSLVGSITLVNNPALMDIRMLAKLKAWVMTWFCLTWIA